MRVKGYVVGYDTKNGELIWTVKVKDETSRRNGEKFVVETLHAGTMLCKPAVDVTFEISFLDKAVDVCLGLEEPKKKLTKDIAESMCFAIVREQGQIYSWFNECRNEAECKKWLKEKSEECELVAFLRINADGFIGGSHGDYPDAHAFFMALRGMMNEMDTVSHVLSAIVSEAFLLGKGKA